MLLMSLKFISRGPLYLILNFFLTLFPLVIGGIFFFLNYCLVFPVTEKLLAFIY